ncbi:hypothetical protein DFJ73DRAFT_584038 [Zopfochytrium polystomum]|nr:hypothetical protein DFJ73DRAFT_584038 [Zopfochytrium polystomum]
MLPKRIIKTFAAMQCGLLLHAASASDDARIAKAYLDREARLFPRYDGNGSPRSWKDEPMATWIPNRAPVFRWTHSLPRPVWSGFSRVCAFKH